ncbi:MAG: sigma-70 family RNA polymerase sigma factor [Ruminococcus sp.]|nr:sigma-70 family RNA polymerase sigma factor [Ruminococcus sp.]
MSYEAQDNLGLVHLCANRFRGRGIEYDDLYGAGCVGLVKASKAFDPERGVRFSTYAVPVILGEIKRLFRDGGAVKASRSSKELSLRITREREKMLLRLGREPTVEELCESLEESAEAVIEAINISLPPVSLTGGDDDDSSPQLDIPVGAPEEEVTDRLALAKVLSQLEPSDKRLIYLRYFKGLTQTVTASQLGMTQVQVSRREKKILQAMREKLI